MPKTKLHETAEFGQSLWLDYINRSMIDSGKLNQWLERGLRGMTSNPSIFNQVISQSSDYDKKILALKEAGKSTFEIYDELTVADIQDACSIFMPVYNDTKQLDGYVSLEINPQLAHDAAASIKEGQRLFQRVNRPNLMIKVPATPAGFPVIEELIAQGINVNVTLIFSLQQYTDTVEAFLKGLERLAEKTGDLGSIRSVASVFVSRVDTMIDKMLDDKIAAAKDPALKQKLTSLKGRAAVANCRLIFERFKELFTSKRFQIVMQKRAAVQRVLWGSTSTKNPAYRDTKYVDELIVNPSVNTVPESTLLAFMEHGQVQKGLTGSRKEAEEVFAALGELDISINQVCARLLQDGVAAFEKSFAELMTSIETKAKQLAASHK